MGVAPREQGSLSGQHGEALAYEAEAAWRVARPLLLGVTYTFVDISYQKGGELDLLFDYRYDALSGFVRFVFD